MAPESRLSMHGRAQERQAAGAGIIDWLVPCQVLILGFRDGGWGILPQHTAAGSLVITHRSVLCLFDLVRRKQLVTA